MSNPAIPQIREYIKCACGGHLIEVQQPSHWWACNIEGISEPPYGAPDHLDLCIWNQHDNPPGTLWERVRYAWKILRGKDRFSDQAVLHREDAVQLAALLHRFIDSVKEKKS